MKKCIFNGRVVLPDGVVDKKAILFDDTIEAILTEEEAKSLTDVELIDAKGNLVMPGLIDVHCHGCAGDDTSDNKEGAIQNMSQMKAKYGTTAWLPTSMTLPLDHLRTTFAQVREAMAKSKADREASTAVGSNSRDRKNGANNCTA